MKKPRRACTACERHIIRGRGARRAWVMDPDGNLAYGLVCVRCAVRAVAFVVPPATTVAPLCGSCHKDRAAVCVGCFARAHANVRELSAANVALRAGGPSLCRKTEECEEVDGHEGPCTGGAH